MGIHRTPISLIAMSLDLYPQNIPLTQKARFWSNYVSALKGSQDLRAPDQSVIRNLLQRCTYSTSFYLIFSMGEGFLIFHPCSNWTISSFPQQAMFLLHVSSMTH